MNRREWLQRAGLGVAALAVPSASMLLDGCKAADWTAKVLGVLGELVPGIDSAIAIVTVFDPAVGAALTSGEAIFKVTLSGLQDLISKWQTASAAAQPGLVAQMDVAAQQLISDSQKLLDLGQIKDIALRNKIAALLTVVSDGAIEVGGLVPIIQGVGGTVQGLATIQVQATLTQITFPTGKIVHTARGIRKNFNDHLLEGTGSALLDAECRKHVI